MRIKIIGDNNCARATRHLLRLAGLAVTEFLPADAVASGPHAGYAITIDLAPAAHTPDLRVHPPDSTVDRSGDAHLRTESPARHHAPAHEEASRVHRGASLPAFVSAQALPTTAGRPASGGPGFSLPDANSDALKADRLKPVPQIHFDSAESALEAAVLRHVTQLAVAPVVVDRPGGVVHSDRELRIVAPNTGDAKADEAAAVAIEFGVLRGLLDLTAPATHKHSVKNEHAEARASSVEQPEKKRWWLFGVALLAAFCGAGLLRAGSPTVPTARLRLSSIARSGIAANKLQSRQETHSASRAPRLAAASLRALMEPHRLKPVLLKPALLAAEPAQGQFATGQGFKITDGNNFWVVDPCKAQTKSYASVNQTANAQLVAGTASKKIYVCSIHVVVAAATNVAIVEGTGTACGTGTAGVGGFGGTTAATGWNFAANGGIALGNGDSSLGAEVASGDNLCVFNSGSGQVSGGISYVVQ